jgi:uncharacterized protein YggE
MRVIQPLLLLLWLAPLYASSQEKFVEVTVSDTAWVKPNQFVYSIWVLPSAADDNQDTLNNFSSYQKKQLAIKTKQRQVLDSLRDMVFKKGFFILPVNVHYAYSTEGEGSNSVDVLTSTTDSLALLYNLIDNNLNVTGRVSSVSSSNEGVYENYLLKKLLSKANAKATEIANLSGIKIGKILSVKEARRESSNGGWAAYPPHFLSSSMEPAWVETRSTGRYQSSDLPTVNGLYPIENTLVVRFAVQ